MFRDASAERRSLRRSNARLRSAYGRPPRGFVQIYGFTRVAGVHRQALSDAIERVVERSVPETSVTTALERTAARWPIVVFVIRLNPRELTNPDADLRYVIPDLLQTGSAGRVQDNGFDYEDGDVFTGHSR